MMTSRCDATGFHRGELHRRTFEALQPDTSAVDHAIYWAEDKGVEVLEISIPPHREKDRRYYVRNPHTGKMNRVSYRRAGIATLMVRDALAQEKPEGEDRDRLISEVLRKAVPGMSSGPGRSSDRDIRRPTSHGPNVNRDVPSVSYPGGQA